MEQSLSKFGPGAAEGDRLEARAVVARHDQADMVGADDARFDDSHRAGRNARRGPAGTIRTRALDRLAPQRINAPWGEHRVDEQRLVAARALDIRSEEHTSELQSLMRNSYAVFCL